MPTLEEITTSQAQKEVTANGNFLSVSPAGIFGKKRSTTTGLTFGFYGGVLEVDGVLTTIADGTVSLTGSTTNYVEATRAGVVSANASGFTAGAIALYTAVTNTTDITTLTDFRVFLQPANYVGSRLSVAWASDANMTLTAAQARAKFILLTGSGPLGQRDLLIPPNGEWFVYNGISGSPSVSIRVIESGSPQGAGVVIANGKGAYVFGDGTNIRRATPDA